MLDQFTIRMKVRKLNLLIVSSKRYSTDFRKYLMRAAERTGARALHVYAAEKLILSWDDAERVEFGTNSHYHAIRNQIADVLGHNPIVGLTELGAAPLRKGPLGLVNILHELPDVCWVYDVYDGARRAFVGGRLLALPLRTVDRAGSRSSGKVPGILSFE